jgi:arginine exporter protein ArgO
VGAAVGALAAIGGAYVGYQLRQFLHRKAHLPQVLAGVAEDAILAGAAVVALRRLRHAQPTRE